MLTLPGAKGGLLRGDQGGASRSLSARHPGAQPSWLADTGRVRSVLLSSWRVWPDWPCWSRFRFATLFSAKPGFL